MPHCLLRATILHTTTDDDDDDAEDDAEDEDENDDGYQNYPPIIYRDKM